MTEKTINVTGDVLECVYRLTANAAVQRGDAQAVATVDNLDMLNQFKEEGMKLLEDAFGRYYIGESKYFMPANWPDLSADINKLAETAIVNYILAKWYELNGSGDKFIVAYKEALNHIKNLLAKRTK